MASLAEHYARFEEEWRQTNRQAEKRKVFEETASHTPDAARLIILGGILEEYIAQTKRLHPKPTEAENDMEFAPVSQFFFQLFEQEFVRQLAEEYFGDST